MASPVCTPALTIQALPDQAVPLHGRQDRPTGRDGPLGMILVGDDRDEQRHDADAQGDAQPARRFSCRVGAVLTVFAHVASPALQPRVDVPFARAGRHRDEAGDSGSPHEGHGADQ